MKQLHVFLSLITIILLSSCEKISIDDYTDQENATKVTLHISGFSIIPFDETTRAAVDITSHIDIALFDADGEKVVKVNQKQGDEDFGNPTFSVAPGTYTLAIVAHSGSGVATITSLDEVSFTNNKVTDTFYTCQTLVVTDKATTTDITLQRAVSMVRFVITDTSFPSEFAQLKLYYTGGSSTFSPSTGLGSKNSRQTEYRTLSEVDRDTEGHPVFEIYTFPHEENDVLKVTLTPQNEAGEDIATDIVIEEVPVQLNCITECEGTLFKNGSSSTFSAPSLSLSIDNQWKETTEYTF